MYICIIRIQVDRDFSKCFVFGTHIGCRPWIQHVSARSDRQSRKIWQEVVRQGRSSRGLLMVKLFYGWIFWPETFFMLQRSQFVTGKPDEFRESLYSVATGP